MTVLQIVLVVLGSLLGVVLTYLFVVVFTPLVREPVVPMPDVEKLPPPDLPPGIRTDVSFGEPGQKAPY